MAPEKDAAKRSAVSALPSLRAALPAPLEHRLMALSQETVRRLATEAELAGGPKLAGLHRQLEPAALDTGRWFTLPGGERIWRFALHSPDAGGLRVRFSEFNVGSGRVWVHDGTGSESQVFGPYTGRGIYGDGEFWSDVVVSDTIFVEFEPGGDGQPLDRPPFTIGEISHLFDGALGLHSPSKIAGRAASASCNLDVSCYPEWAETARAVGHIVFERQGSTFVCSGTLLNTTNGGGQPLFLTADHCIADDTMARSIQAFWFYQSQTCNGTPATRRDSPRTLGARYLAGTGFAQGDYTLVQLNEVPSGVVFSGWSADPLPGGANVTGIHHPAGDPKKISFGVSQAARTPAGVDASSFVGSSWIEGVTEGGSSGSGLFSQPGVLVGTLSHGPKADTPEGYCVIRPLVDNYGRFSVAYPTLRQFLDGRTTAPPPPPPSTGNAATLTSGQARNFNFDAVSSATLFRGSSAFQITVPQGATRLEVRLATTTPNADLDLFVRFGSEPEVSGGRVVADYTSESTSGNETVVITTESSPPLRAGTYFVALGIFTTGVSVSGNVTATVSSGSTPPPAGSRALASGVSRSFSIGPVTSGTLFNGQNGFTVDVPQNATRLEIRITTGTANADVDLFARFGADVVVESQQVVADYRSDGLTGDESIVITASSSPPLRAGTYFVGLGLFTSNVTATGSIIATVTSGGGTGGNPPGGNNLTSGTARSFNLGAVQNATLFNRNSGFQIAVPQGASRLEVRLQTSTPNADLDLFVRFGSDPSVEGGRVVSDYRSEGPTGEETVVITASSTPPLRAGTYFIAIGQFTPNLDTSATITATVTSGGSAPPPSGPTVLTSGTPVDFQVGPVSSPTLLNGSNSYRIEVPEGATRLEIRLQTATANADIDLFARFASDTSVQSGDVVADHSSEGPAGEESIIVSSSSSPPLRPGTYFISLALFTTEVTATGTLTATVSTDAAPPPATSGGLLNSGQPSNFSLPPVDAPTLFYGDYSFRIQVPEGATRLDVRLSTTTPSADLDLFVRYEADTDVADGQVVADHVSDGPTGSESISITPTGNPPLRAGTYYISLVNYSTNVAVTGTVTATLTTGGGAAPPPNSATVLTSGTPAKFRLPAVSTASLYNGVYSFTINVPEGSTRLQVQLTGDVPAVDVDLFVRYGVDAVLDSGNIIADYASTGPTGNETLSITAGSVPALRPGTYYISLALFTTSADATGSVTAIVERGAITPPVSGAQTLRSGVPASFSLPAVSQPTFFAGDYGFRINVPADSERLEISVRTEPSNIDVDLAVRYGAEPTALAADHRSAGNTGNEQIIIQQLSVPPLRVGTYFIALPLWSTGVPARGTVTATVFARRGANTETLRKNPPGARVDWKRLAIAEPLAPEWKNGAVELSKPEGISKRKAFAQAISE
jgi:hypothetical protein